jgi:phosphatidylinositol dimannoside acyltransferase
VPGLRDKLIDVGYGLGWSLVCRLPESWARQAFSFAADIAWRRQGPQVQVLEGNLRRVLGAEASGAQLRALSRESLRSTARYYLEIFRLPVMPVDRLVAGMRDIGHVETAFEYTAAGRGVVFALPHMGNWDQAGAWIIARGAGSFTTVQERLKPESVYDRFVAFREGLGMEVLPASGGNSRFGILAQRLRAGKIVCLPCDRDVTGGGIEVDFFGEKARMMAGPAALAVQTGAALMPATLWFEDDEWGLNIHQEIPVPAEGDRKQKTAAMTQEIARLFEAAIRAHPQDWHMMQKVFVADLDPDRLAAAEAAAQSAETAAGAGHDEGRP